MLPLLLTLKVTISMLFQNPLAHTSIVQYIPCCVMRAFANRRSTREQRLLTDSVKRPARSRCLSFCAVSSGDLSRPCHNSSGFHRPQAVPAQNGPLTHVPERCSHLGILIAAKEHSKFRLTLAIHDRTC